MQTQTPDHHTFAPRDLWSIAGEMITHFFALFGAPEELARQGGVSGAARALLLTWLRGCEAVLRHLLLIEALAILPTLAPMRVTSRLSHARARHIVTQSPNAPETWRVSFRVLPAQRRTRASTRARKPIAVESDADFFKDPERTARLRAEKAAWLRQLNALALSSSGRAGRAAIGGAAAWHDPNGVWPLAERAEAMLRAFNAPAPHARRLARRLRHAPHRARALMRFPPDIDRCCDRARISRLHRHTREAFNTS